MDGPQPSAARDGREERGRQEPTGRRDDLGRRPERPIAVVFASGDGSDPPPAGTLPDADLVVAADSGLGPARGLGLHVDVLVGDLDSVAGADLEAARDEGTRVERHPVAKDQIDLELALDTVRDLGARCVVVVAGAGGRLDMVLANVAVLAHPRFAGLRLEAWIGRGWLAVVHGPGGRALEGRAGEVVSLLPAGGPVTGVRTEGLRYPLRGEALDPGSSRGVSNELLGARASVRVDTGTLLVVRPDVLEGGS